MKKLILLSAGFLFSFALSAQNSALSFDGQAEYLTLSHDDAYNIGDGFTIEAWILAKNWRDARWQGSIMNSDNQGPDRGFAFRCGDNGSLSFVMAVDNVWEEAFTSPLMNANQWHHVAVVVDNGTITLYVDGQPSANHSFTGNPSHSPDLPINIGASPGFGSRHFDGVIDEVRIWNVARSQSEIANNTTTDFTGSESGLVGYFPMNEGMGNVAGDLSPTQNDCALVQMDNSNWVDGYTLPDYDVSVQSVYGIDVVNMVDRPVKLSVTLQNSGTQPISDIDLEVSIDGDFYNMETITATIAPGDVLDYEFELPIDLIGTTDPEITVAASHPDDGNALNNETALTVKSGTSTRIIVSDKSLHKNGEQQNSFIMTLPNDLHRYERLLLNIDLTCPFGGCGAWDVLADLKAITSSGTYELARYITPYGIACGGWVVDITDFKSVLGGQVEFLTSITVYTEQGWLLDMSIDLIDNDASDTYSTITPLWEKGYQVYGDPGISYDLDEMTLAVNNNTETNHVRMTITGHGQGNTNNAAEFYNVTHRLEVDGNTFHNHNLWKSDCASNSCDNQLGSWLFPRAGWCPGQQVIPYIINTTSVASAGTTVSMDYELQQYTNLLNTGYNNTGHTEPYYRIHSYFVEESSSSYRDYNNLAVTSIDAVADDIMVETVDLVIQNNGQEDITEYTANIFLNTDLVHSETINETIEAGMTADKTIDVGLFFLYYEEEYNIYAEVVADQDDNPGDNVIKYRFSTSTKDEYLDYAFDIYPNPTSDGQLQLDFDEYWRGSTVKIYAATGVLVDQFELSGSLRTVSLDHSGTYWYSVVHPKYGQTHTGKVVYVD